MKIPNSKNAFVDILKLEGYCLNPEHPVGKHKARVFKSVLSLDMRDAKILKEYLLKAVVSEEAEETETDDFGTRYNLKSEMEHKGKKAFILSVWMIRTGEDFPRLVSCYVTGEQK